MPASHHLICIRSLSVTFADYSEGYEIGETDGSGSGGGGAPPGVPPPVYADDTVYYGPPATEAAVFTDPHTGQVYYGKLNPFRIPSILITKANIVGIRSVDNNRMMGLDFRYLLTLTLITTKVI